MQNNLQLMKTFLSHQGEQRIYTHDSDVLQCKMRFAVFLPKAALGESPELCPSIYYLSGLTCTEENVIEKSGFQRFAARYDTIFICPDTSPRGQNITDDERFWVGQGAGFYINATESPWDTNYKMYDYLDQELPKLIDENFPTNGLQSICGHSMGGFGALNLGLRNPERYTSISAFAPICSIEQNSWLKDAFPLYLGKDQSKWQQYNPSHLIQSATQKTPILIDQGTADEFLDQLGTDQFKTICEEADYPATIQFREGYDHSYYFIRSFIAEHFVFHLEHLELD